MKIKTITNTIPSLLDEEYNKFSDRLDIDIRYGQSHAIYDNNLNCLVFIMIIFYEKKMKGYK